MYNSFFTQDYILWLRKRIEEKKHYNKIVLESYLNSIRSYEYKRSLILREINKWWYYEQRELLQHLITMSCITNVNEMVSGIELNYEHEIVKQFRRVVKMENNLCHLFYQLIMERYFFECNAYHLINSYETLNEYKIRLNKLLNSTPKS